MKEDAGKAASRNLQEQTTRIRKAGGDKHFGWGIQHTEWTNTKDTREKIKTN